MAQDRHGNQRVPLSEADTPHADRIAAGEAPDAAPDDTPGAADDSEA
jgi:hypothetical protein